VASTASISKDVLTRALGVIRSNENLLFREMLASQDVVACHPRKHDDSVNAVAALKPYWEDRKGIFDWTDFE